MAGVIASAAPVQHRSRGIVRINFAITCDASGVATATKVGVGFGRLVGVLYNGGLDASAVLTIADQKTGASVVAYTTGTEATPVGFRPSTVIADNAGVAVAAATTAAKVNRDITFAGGITVGVTSGGVSETCAGALIIDEDGVGDLANTV